jgi:hypothetical protein
MVYVKKTKKSAVNILLLWLKHFNMTGLGLVYIEVGKEPGLMAIILSRL